MVYFHRPEYGVGDGKTEIPAAIQTSCAKFLDTVLYRDIKKICNRKINSRRHITESAAVVRRTVSQAIKRVGFRPVVVHVEL